MRRAAFLFAMFAFGASEVRAQGALVTWDRLDVSARLGNDGRLEVAETHEIKVSGEAAVIDRSFNYAADQSVVVHGVFRLEADGSRIAFKDAPVETADAYQVYRWGLRFSLRGEHDPAFKSVETRRYVIEYALLGALTPAWDLAAGPLPLDQGTSPRDPRDRLKEVWVGWRGAWPDIDRHYRLDHDVVFPSRDSTDSTLPLLNYRFEFGDAWVLLDKDRDIGIATPDVDYRVQRLLRYLPEGRPNEVDVNQAASRLSAVFAPLALGLGFGLLFIAVDRLSRPGLRGDRGLFESRVALLPKEIIQEEMGEGVRFLSFETFLLRMAAEKKVAITIESAATGDDDAEVRLRLTTDRAKLTPFEREVAQEIFGSATAVSTADIQNRFRGRTFEADEVVARALAKLRPKRVSKGRPLWSAFHLSLMALGVGLMIKSLTDQAMSDPVPLIVGLVPGNLLVTLWPIGAKTRRPGLVKIFIGIVTLGLLGAALALSPNTPLSGIASLGLAVLSTGHCVGLLARQPKPASTELDAARLWALAELKKPRPDLRDGWVDALEALGASKALARWKSRFGGVMGGGDLGDTGQVALSAGPPFTGEAPRLPMLPDDWTDGFSVWGGDEGDDNEDGA